MLTDELNTLEFRHLLKVVDDIREILHHEKISLPHIVVVGDQSHDIQADLTLIDLPEDVRFGSLPICTNPLSPIEHFIINDNYNLDEVEIILSSIFLMLVVYPLNTPT
ncbi:unnamed protein product [Rotaria sordida]|uniref:Uncharacterized protein n=1 Tax=Rotaria sordida TaxID=392033 RepID=A0A814XXA5_9BILA|nr:unnamed protein product [Rotaria sordida]